MSAYHALCDSLDAHVQLVYITYHVDVGETPFLVALDFEQRAVVVCVRGTLSLKVREHVINGLSLKYYRKLQLQLI